MKIEFIDSASGGKIAKLCLLPGERAHLDPNARIAMTPGMALETNVEGPLSLPAHIDFGALAFGKAISVLAPAMGGEIWLAPVSGGEMTLLRVEPRGLDVHHGRILAADLGIHLELQLRGFRTVPGDTAPLCRASGEGELLLALPGAMLSTLLADKEQIVVPLRSLAACHVGMSIEVMVNLFPQPFDQQDYVPDLRITGPGQVLISRP